MDDYMFKYYVERCKYVQETTSYIEIHSYSDPNLNTIEEHRLADDDFDNWLQEKGAFTPRTLPPGVRQLAALRLVVQQNAKQPETFAPSVLSLKPKDYMQMVDSLRLPYRGIESTSVCGPFFWAALDQDDENPHIQLVFRKSDVKKKGMTRGWELMLSHNLKTGVTAGFIKGTPSSEVEKCLKHLKECALQIRHPLLLPMIIFSHDMAPATDIKQRDARDWLRRLENAVSMRMEIQEKESYVDDRGVVDFDLINRHLVECHSQVLWKRPLAYMRILDSMQKAMDEFLSTLETDKKKEVSKLHRSMLARMDFYRHKLEGIDSYAHTTLQRLEVQRSALYNMIAQKESKLNFQMAGEQRKLAYASKRDSSAMKTISLLGAIFLPGAFLASIFSTTFFQFQFPSPSTIVSSDFYIFWVCTIPITILVILVWWVWENRRDKRYRAEDEDLERGVEDMEADIMAMMRKRTMSKVSTWNEKSRVEPMGPHDERGNSSGGHHMHLPGGIHMPGAGGIHLPGNHRPHTSKRADAVSDEHVLNANNDEKNARPKVRIADNNHSESIDHAKKSK